VFNIAAILQWISIGQQVIEKGAPAWAAVKVVLASHSISSDTSALDEVIADADRRRQVALAESK